MNTDKNEIGYSIREHKQEWMTEEILRLMNECRKYNNQENKSMYNRFHGLMRRKIHVAKN